MGELDIGRQVEDKEGEFIQETRSRSSLFVFVHSSEAVLLKV